MVPSLWISFLLPTKTSLLIHSCIGGMCSFWEVLLLSLYQNISKLFLCLTPNAVVHAIVSFLLENFNNFFKWSFQSLPVLREAWETFSEHKSCFFPLPAPTPSNYPPSTPPRAMVFLQHTTYNSMFPLFSLNIIATISYYLLIWIFLY